MSDTPNCYTPDKCRQLEREVAALKAEVENAQAAAALHWAEIERLAAQELRSSNAQVEYLLRESLERRGRRADPSAAPRAGETPTSDRG